MKDTLKKAIPLALFLITSIATIFLSIRCMAGFQSGFLAEYAAIITSTLVTFEILYCIAALIFLLLKKNIIFKFLLSGAVLAAILLLGLFLFQITGLLDKIDSIEDLRKMVESIGAWPQLVFVVIQILQVFLLPLPGVLTVGAGVAMFGEFEACLLSYIGIVIGSCIAFLIGRVVGYRAAAWLVGKESLDKWLLKIKGKDRRILTVMFLLPVFPDDILCVVAGLSTMSWRYFIVTQLIARAISVVATSYSLGGSIIPYNTWWGILLWILIAVAILALFIAIYKKGDKIEQWIFSLFSKRKQPQYSKAKKDASLSLKQTTACSPKKTHGREHVSKERNNSEYIPPTK